MIEFQEFRKIPRLSRDIVITEKIDGTNGVIYFDDEMQMYVGSRTRWITPENDNYGFARWAWKNKDELVKLGTGFHYGEWWGSGIQRGYNLPKGEKRFSLFNVSKWEDDGVRPECCQVVPTLFIGNFDTNIISTQIERLRTLGSVVVPGYMKPEGIVIFHTASGYLFKKTLEKDEKPKSESNN